MENFIEYVKYNLKKRWKKRTPVIATYVFSISNLMQIHLFNTFYIRIFLFMILTTVMILVDEWVKEGHFFDPYDIGGLTHETLALVFMPLLIPVALYLRRIRRRLNNAIQSTMDYVEKKLT